MHYKNYIFVAIQIVLFIAFIFEIDSLKFNQLEFFQPVFLVLSGIGFLIILSAILELNTSLSPFPKPKNKASLVTTGVYRYIRHPIYTGILLGLFFIGLYFSSFYKIGLVFLLGFLFWYKSGYEEEQLCLKYPNYVDYRQKTPGFFPKFMGSR